MKAIATRRSVLLATATAGFTALAPWSHAKEEEDQAEVTANEDLMREHGVIRRALFVYREAARRARADPASVPLRGLLDTARLMRRFAEDYHEHALEETHIFPVVRKLKSPVSQLPEVLLTQHQRGREITDYVIRVAGGTRVGQGGGESLAATLETFVAMYGPHTAREDTVLFPAWKAALGEKNYEEMGEQFEDLERKMLGADGFEHALKQIAGIEESFGLANLSTVTAPPPPAA
ncbi:MAG: hemerythrin domain-containing protein [Proteobacteria bacterium]|nr:hemerythrin domain-containing protein [Pseudomonadota bacterium]